MPNWCTNVAYFSHKEKEPLYQLREAVKKESLLEHVFPTPPYQSLQGVITLGKKEQLAEENLRTIGYKNIVDWQYHTRGTKWDIIDAEVFRIYKRPTTFTFKATYDTAWGIPEETYNKLYEMGFNVKVFYHEPLMMFCGRYENKHRYIQHYAFDGNGNPDGWEIGKVPKHILNALKLNNEWTSNIDLSIEYEDQYE